MANGSPMIEPTRRRGFSEPYGSWKIICISRRSGRSSARDSVLMSVPSNVTRPAVRSYSRVMQRASVDLPQPVSPTRPSVSPRSTSRLTPSTARSDGGAAPKSLRRPTGKYLRRPRPRASSLRASPEAVALRFNAVSTVCGSQHADVCPGPISRSGGVSTHASNADGHRGANGQPGGGVIRLGGVPPIGVSRPRRPAVGSERSSPSV